jgi:hypothetical protein
VARAAAERERPQLVGPQQVQLVEGDLGARQDLDVDLLLAQRGANRRHSLAHLACGRRVVVAHVGGGRERGDAQGRCLECHPDASLELRCSVVEAWEDVGVKVDHELVRPASRQCEVNEAGRDKVTVSCKETCVARLQDHHILASKALPAD